MYSTYALGIFLLLGVVGGLSIGNNSRMPDSKPHFSNARDGGRFSRINIENELNPRDLTAVDNALNDVYKHFFGPPPFALTLTSNTGKDNSTSNLARTVSAIGSSLCNHMENVLQKYGIDLRRQQVTTRSLLNSTSLEFSTYYELMRMPLRIKTIWREITGYLNKYVNNQKYLKSGYKKVAFPLRFQPNNALGNSSNEWGLFEILHIIDRYPGNFTGCLLNNRTRTFDLQQSVLELANAQPEQMVKILKSRFEKPVPKPSNTRDTEYTHYQAFICHVVSKNPANDYHNCLKGISHLEKCVLEKIQKSLSETPPTPENTKNFIKTIESLNKNSGGASRGSTLSAIRRESKKNPLNHDISYIVDFAMGDLKKSPLLRRMANELVSELKNSNIGTNILRETAFILKIYNDGLEKREHISKNPKGNAKLRYSKISENLENYKRHVSELTTNTINRMNLGMLKVQKMLADTSNKVHVDLSANVEMLKSFSNLVGEYLANRHGNEKGINESTVLSQIPSSRNALSAIHPVGTAGRSYDKNLRALIKAAKGLGETVSFRRSSSALITLANTFLLATMFYECIALLAGAIYRDENTGSSSASPNYSSEVDDSSNWQSQYSRNNAQEGNSPNIRFRRNVTEIPQYSTEEPKYFQETFFSKLRNDEIENIISEKVEYFVGYPFDRMHKMKNHKPV